MPSLIVLALYGVMAAAVIGGGWALKRNYDTGIRNAQIAADTLILDKVKKERDVATDQAAQRQAETQACVDKAAVQSAAVTDLDKRTKAAQEASRRAVAEANAKAAAQSGELAKLRALASAAPVVDQSCQETLAKTDAILRSMVKVKGATK